MHEFSISSYFPVTKYLCVTQNTHTHTLSCLSLSLFSDQHVTKTKEFICHSSTSTLVLDSKMKAELRLHPHSAMYMPLQHWAWPESLPHPLSLSLKQHRLVFRSCCHHAIHLDPLPITCPELRSAVRHGD